MAKEVLEQAYETRLYLARAHQMIGAAVHNLDGGFYASAVNRAYMPSFMQPMRS